MRRVMAAVLVAGVGTAAMAQDADEAVKFRKNAMGNLGNTSEMLGAALQGQSDIDVAAITAVLAAASRPEITIEAFRQDTDGETFEQETTALPLIWQQWDDFEGRFRELAAATEELAARGDDLTLQEAGQALNRCRDCHETYRRR